MKNIIAILLFLPLFGSCQRLVLENKDTAVIEYEDTLVTMKVRKVKVHPYNPTTTITFNPAIIPVTDPDLIAPGRGAEQWHNGSAGIPNPTEASNVTPLDVYYRFEWHKIEGATKGSYTWAYFDGLVKSAIDKGQKLSFGIMPFNSDKGGGVSYAGGESSYPLYLHNLMQGEVYKDWLSNGEWVPNWNSPHYIGRLQALHEAIRNRLLTQYYTPSAGPNAGKKVLFGDAIYCIDIRGYGNWGEWHSGQICNWTAYPTGRQPTATTLKLIIDAHTKVFDRWPLVMMIAAYDGGKTGIPLFHPYREVAYYALTARNAWGDVGYRRDQWGATDSYLTKMLEGNDLTYNGSQPFKDIILNKWKSAPVTGEPNPGTANSTGMSDLMRQVTTYHPTSIGNGNYGSYPSSLDTRNRIREAFKACGYRYQIKEASITTGANGKISVTWENVGLSPTYEDWIVVYELKSGSTVVWSYHSKFKLKFFTGSITATDNTIVPTGDYTLTVKIIDPTGYRQPLVLANKGRNPDGSYNLIP